MQKSLPPGPKGHFLFGNFQDFSENTLEFLKDIIDFGNIASFRLGPAPIYMVNHPDAIHQVLLSDAAKFYKDKRLKGAMRQLTGNSIFISDGEYWQRQRRLTQPAFHAHRVASYAQLMVDFAVAMRESWQDGELYYMSHEMTELTLQVVTKALFNAEVKDEAHELGVLTKDAISIFNARMNAPILFPNWLPTKNNRRMKYLVKRMDKLIYGFIHERRASGEDKGDLLSMLLLAQDELGTGQMTDKQVRDEMITLYGAGHETTANTLTWVWYLLSQYPEVEAKLHQEIDDVLDGRLPTVDDLPNLQYTEMVIKETMRLYPPLMFATRQAIEPVQIDDYLVPKDAIVFVNIYGVHHNGEFFPEPEKFDPEHFRDENQGQLHKYAYIPFGGGPRICIGHMFAMMEAKLLLATLAQSYRMVLKPNHTVIPKRLFTLLPKEGLPMIAEKREC